MDYDGVPLLYLVGPTCHFFFHFKLLCNTRKKNVSYFAFLNHHEIKEVFEVEKIPQGGSEHGPLGL